MIVNLLKKLFVPIFILGIIGFLTIEIFGENSSVVHQYTNSFGMTYYRIDLPQYLSNLELAIEGQDLWTAMAIQLPETPSVDINYVANTGIYLVDILILITNVTLLLPLKIIVYPLNLTFAILGLDIANNGLYKTLTEIAGFSIPYIPLI